MQTDEQFEAALNDMQSWRDQWVARAKQQLRDNRADLQQQLAAAQERTSKAEASNAALKDTLLRQFRLSVALSEAAARQVGDDIVADGISATEVREVTAQVVAALNSPNPGAALLADARAVGIALAWAVEHINRYCEERCDWRIRDCGECALGMRDIERPLARAKARTWDKPEEQP